jgi:WD40 repeat protein
MKQFTIGKEFQIKMNFRRAHKSGIFDMLIGIYSLLTCDNSGHIIQWSLPEENMKEYGCVHPGGVHNSTVAKNFRQFFISDRNGNLSQVNVSEKKITSYGRVLQGGIWALDITDDSKYLFMSNNAGSLVQWDFRRAIVWKEYGRAHQGLIITLLCSGGNMVTLDTNSVLGVWSIQDKGIAKVYELSYPEIIVQIQL